MKKTLLAIIFGLIISLPSVAQNKSDKAEPDSVAYYMRNDHVVAYDEKDAAFLRLIIKSDSGLYNIQDYYMDAKPRISAKSFIKEADCMSGFQGNYSEYYKTGVIKRERNYTRGVVNGDSKSYYPNGKLYAIHTYKENELIELKKCQDSTGKILADNGNGMWLKFDDNFDGNLLKGPVVNSKEDGEWKRYMLDGSVFTIIYKNGEVISGQQYLGHLSDISTAVDKAPSFPGGDAALAKYLSKNITYPLVAKNKNIQGRVILTFVIDRDGTVINFKVLRSPDESLSQEAMRVMAKSPAWKPGILNGKPVKVQYSIPVNFSLETIETTPRRYSSGAIFSN